MNEKDKEIQQNREQIKKMEEIIELAKKAPDVSLYQTRINKLENELLTFQEKFLEINQKKKEIAQLKEKNEKIEIENCQKLQQKIQGLQKDKSDLSEQINTLQKTKQQAESENLLLRQNIETYANQIQNLKQTQNNLNQTSMNFKENERLNHPLFFMENQYSENSRWLSKLQTLQRENFEKVSENRNLLQKLEKTSERLFYEEQKNEEFQTQKKLYERQIQQLETENSTLKLNLKESQRNPIFQNRTPTNPTYYGFMENEEEKCSFRSETNLFFERKWKLEKEALIKTLTTEHQNYLSQLLNFSPFEKGSSHNHLVQQNTLQFEKIISGLEQSNKELAQENSKKTKLIQEKDLLFQEIELETQQLASASLKSEVFDFDWLKETMKERIENLK